MKLIISVGKGSGTHPTPSVCFSLSQEVLTPGWMDNWAGIRQVLSREILQDLQKAVDDGTAILDEIEAEEAIRAEIAARVKVA